MRRRHHARIRHGFRSARNHRGYTSESSRRGSANRRYWRPIDLQDDGNGIEITHRRALPQPGRAPDRGRPASMSATSSFRNTTGIRSLSSISMASATTAPTRAGQSFDSDRARSPTTSCSARTGTGPIPPIARRKPVIASPVPARKRGRDRNDCEIAGPAIEQTEAPALLRPCNRHVNRDQQLVRLQDRGKDRQKEIASRNHSHPSCASGSPSRHRARGLQAAIAPQDRHARDCRRTCRACGWHNVRSFRPHAPAWGSRAGPISLLASASWRTSAPMRNRPSPIYDAAEFLDAVDVDQALRPRQAACSALARGSGRRRSAWRCRSRRRGFADTSGSVAGAS